LLLITPAESQRTQEYSGIDTKVGRTTVVSARPFGIEDAASVLLVGKAVTAEARVNPRLAIIYDDGTPVAEQTGEVLLATLGCTQLG